MKITWANVTNIHGICGRGNARRCKNVDERDFSPGQNGNALAASCVAHKLTEAATESFSLRTFKRAVVLHKYRLKNNPRAIFTISALSNCLTKLSAPYLIILNRVEYANPVTFIVSENVTIPKNNKYSGQ